MKDLASLLIDDYEVYTCTVKILLGIYHAVDGLKTCYLQLSLSDNLQHKLCLKHSYDQNGHFA